MLEDSERLPIHSYVTMTLCLNVIGTMHYGIVDPTSDSSEIVEDLLV